jgi:hypothetical protein
MTFPTGAPNNINAPAPDYNPANWKLGYQTSQFGVGSNPTYAPSGGAYPPSVIDAMASPPAAMIAAYEEPAPPQGIGGQGEMRDDPNVILGGTPWGYTIYGGTP